MKVYTCDQGSPEWHQLRLGLPTASDFHRVITPKGNPSDGQEPYLFELLAERLTGEPADQFQNRWTNRGKELEVHAVAYYEFQREMTTELAGFVTTDDGLIGASPDRLVGDKGLLEVKCRKPAEHLSYLLNEGAVYKKAMIQAQGQLLVAEREFNDIMAYHPTMPEAIYRVSRDEPFLEKLDKELHAFVQRLESLYAECISNGWAKPLEKAAPSLQELLRDSLEAING